MLPGILLASEREEPSLTTENTRPARSGARAKLLVVLLGLAVFLPIIAWRSLRALEETAAEDVLFEYDCRGRLSYLPLNEIGAPFARANIHRYAEMPDVPAIRLGTLHLLAPVGILEGLDDGRPVEYACLRVAKEALGANAWVFEGIERDARLPEGVGRLSEPVYLLHAGRLPAWLRGDFSQVACVVSNVSEGSRAQAAGLRAGDLLLALDGTPVRQDDPCAIGQEIAWRNPRKPISLRVVRDQVPLDLEAYPAPEGESFGCRYRRLPLLDEATLARLPLVFERG